MGNPEKCRRRGRGRGEAGVLRRYLFLGLRHKLFMSGMDRC